MKYCMLNAESLICLQKLRLLSDATHLFEPALHSSLVNFVLIDGGDLNLTRASDLLMKYKGNTWLNFLI